MDPGIRISDARIYTRIQSDIIICETKRGPIACINIYGIGRTYLNHPASKYVAIGACCYYLGCSGIARHRFYPQHNCEIIR
jgi:hypothetical protein